MMTPEDIADRLESIEAIEEERDNAEKERDALRKENDALRAQLAFSRDYAVQQQDQIFALTHRAVKAEQERDDLLKKIGESLKQEQDEVRASRTAKTTTRDDEDRAFQDFERMAAICEFAGGFDYFTVNPEYVLKLARKYMDLVNSR